jgi:hypothetical protein
METAAEPRSARNCYKIRPHDRDATLPTGQASIEYARSSQNLARDDMHRHS